MCYPLQLNITHMRIPHSKQVCCKKEGHPLAQVGEHKDCCLGVCLGVCFVLFYSVF